MRRRASIGPLILVIAVGLILVAALGPVAGAVGPNDVREAGWGEGLSPLGLIIGLIVLFLVLKLVFRLAAGPRWYSGPGSWGHSHAGWHGDGHRDATDAFRRWHDQAHGSTGQDPARRSTGMDQAAARPTEDHEDRDQAEPRPASPPSDRPVVSPQPAAPAPAQWPYAGPPQWPYPGQAPQGYPGQAPQGYPGQAPQGPYPGQAPQWPHQGPPPSYPGQPPAGPDR
jgi:hypothetical protein